MSWLKYYQKEIGKRWSVKPSKVSVLYERVLLTCRDLFDECNNLWILAPIWYNKLTKHCLCLSSRSGKVFWSVEFLRRILCQHYFVGKRNNLRSANRIVYSEIISGLQFWSCHTTRINLAKSNSKLCYESPRSNDAYYPLTTTASNNYKDGK